MTPDRYTKAVLTVIAACLVYLCIAVTTGSPVSAQTDGPQRVIIVGWKEWGSSGRVIELPRSGGRFGGSPIDGIPMSAR
ncbi:MAG: hypothetical protein AB7Q29_10385 [Vicinamibacterales bacterium]